MKRFFLGFGITVLVGIAAVMLFFPGASNEEMEQVGKYVGGLAILVGVVTSVVWKKTPKDKEGDA